MLVLTRGMNEQTHLYDEHGILLGTVSVTKLNGHHASLGFDFGRAITILRAELCRDQHFDKSQRVLTPILDLKAIAAECGILTEEDITHHFAGMVYKILDSVEKGHASQEFKEGLIDSGFAVLEQLAAHLGVPLGDTTT